MNFVEEGAARAALEGELSASQALARSPTSSSAKRNDTTDNKRPVGGANDPNTFTVAEGEEMRMWAMIQNRLDPRVHAQTMGVNSPANLGFGMTNLTMSSADSVDYVLNTATIPKDVEQEMLHIGTLTPKVEISEKRKQWLTQLLEKKKRAAERKAALSQGESDPISTTSVNSAEKQLSKGTRHAESIGAWNRKKKKRQQGSMSNSEYESDVEQAGVVKFRRTSRSSKVDSSSEVSDVESYTPRSTKASRRRKSKSKGPQQRSESKGKSKGSTGSLDNSEQSSVDLDEIFDKLHVDSSESAGEIPHTYSIDHLAFLEDSQNTHRNKGRIGSIDLGSSFNARGLGTSMQLDTSLGLSLDDSVRFWQAETSAAQKDLQSFVTGFAESEENPKPREAPEALTKDTESDNVVSSLFDLNANNMEDDDQLEKSWLMATDPASLSVGMLGSLDLSMIAKSFDASRKRSPPRDNDTNEEKSEQSTISKPLIQDLDVSL